MLVRVLGADDRELEGDCAPFRVAPSRVWSTTVASRELVDVVEVLGIIAIADEQRVGLVTSAARVNELEAVTFQVDPDDQGVGRARMDTVVGNDRGEAIRRIWLVTANDKRPAATL